MHSTCIDSILVIATWERDTQLNLPDLCSRHLAPVAQMREYLTSNQRVLGSNPSWSRFFLDTGVSPYLIIYTLCLFMLPRNSWNYRKQIKSLITQILFINYCLLQFYWMMQISILKRRDKKYVIYTQQVSPNYKASKIMRYLCQKCDINNMAIIILHQNVTA